MGVAGEKLEAGQPVFVGDKGKVIADYQPANEDYIATIGVTTGSGSILTTGGSVSVGVNRIDAIVDLGENCGCLVFECGVLKRHVKPSEMDAFLADRMRKIAQ